MTSAINYSAITTTYPVAGVDNDSQGFRDNFTAISAALAVAKTEISNLQTVSVIKADLATQSTPVVNDLLASTLTNGSYNKLYGIYFDGGTVATSSNIDLANGPVQKFTLSGTPTLTFTNWPAAGQSGYIRVHFASDQNGVRYPVLSTANSGTIRYDTSYPVNPVTSGKGFLIGGESVATIVMGNQGSGYISSATISFNGGNPITGAVTPSATATYTVVSATVSISGGTGYAVGDILSINGYPGTLVAVSTISGGGGTGPVTAVSVSVGGTYTLPLTSVYGTNAVTGAGTGCRLSISFGIGAINITNPGDGYTTVAPNVGISAPASGTQATATSTLTTGTATKIKVIEAWSNNQGADVYVRYLGEY
jgi:hypothetical protein